MALEPIIRSVKNEKHKCNVCSSMEISTRSRTVIGAGVHGKCIGCGKERTLYGYQLNLPNDIIDPIIKTTTFPNNILAETQNELKKSIQINKTIDIDEPIVTDIQDKFFISKVKEIYTTKVDNFNKEWYRLKEQKKKIIEEQKKIGKEIWKYQNLIDNI